MKLSLTIQTPEYSEFVDVALLTGTFDEKLEKAANFGANGVELMTVEPSKLDTNKIKSSLQKNKLEIAAVSSGAIASVTGLTLLNENPTKANKAANLLYNLIDFASAVESPFVTIGGFRGLASSVGNGANELLISILHKASVYAELKGVRLALEPLNRYETDIIQNAEEGLRFVNKVQHHAFGLLLDTYHINIEENSWTEPFIQVMEAKKLFHVHIGDNNRLPPSCGLIDFNAIVSTLKQIGYNGFLSAELLANPNPDFAAEKTLSYLNSLLKF